MPRNAACTSQIVITADRHKISSKALNNIIASEKVKDVWKEFALRKKSTLRGRRKHRCKKFNTVKEKLLVDVDIHCLTIYWHKKLSKSGKAYIYKEHLAVLASTTNGKVIKLLDSTNINGETGLNQAIAIKDMVEGLSIVNKGVALCFDPTAFNTGKIAETFYRHSLWWTSCRHHMLGIVLGNAFRVVFGPTSRPAVDFFDILTTKRPTLNLFLTTFLKGSIGSIQVKGHKVKPIQILQNLHLDKNAYLLRNDFKELLELSLVYLDPKICW